MKSIMSGFVDLVNFHSFCKKFYDNLEGEEKEVFRKILRRAGIGVTLQELLDQIQSIPVKILEPIKVEEIRVFPIGDSKKKSVPHVSVILHELAHSKVNHPDNVWPWKSFDFVHQVAVMMEEAGEAVRAANNMKEGKGGSHDLYNELAQTAAMCIRCMEQLMEYSRRDKSGNQMSRI